MGRRSTITGYWRQRGDSADPATPAGVLSVLLVTFNPSQAAGTATGVYMPKGAIPMFAFALNSAGTGGTNPTFDVGLEGVANDALINEGDADTEVKTLISLNSAYGLADVLTTKRQILAGQGASAATGGTVTVGIVFAMNDDQSVQD